MLGDQVDTGAKPVASGAAEGLLGRFAAVWIWTVFFGLNGGLTYSFLGSMREVAQIGLMGIAGRGPAWGGPNAVLGGEMMALIMPLAFSIGLVASIASWLYLYLFFSVYIVPTVFLEGRPAAEDRRRRLAAAYVARTYQLLILAALARATPDILYLFLPLIDRLGML